MGGGRGKQYVGYLGGQVRVSILKIINILRYFTMAEEECPTLRWGDIIRIHGVNLSKKNQAKGLIISKGFTDSNIYYQRYEEFSDVNFYRESLFQILPRYNFDIHDQLLDENIKGQQRESLKVKSLAQVNGLKGLLKSKAGEEVRYGNQVIFKHVQSQSYLRGILKAADQGEGAFKVEVCESLSSNVIFRLTSHRSYERDNDKIYYDDPLQIYHPGSDCFTNFVEADTPIFLDDYYFAQQIPQDHEFKPFQRQRPYIKKPKFMRVPIINENKSKCLWKFIQHCTSDEYNEKEKIKSHDIVYFKHTKKKGLVSSTLSEPIRYYLKESQNESLSFESFWELIPKEVKEFEPEDCSSFKARNIITGKQLEFKNSQIEIQPDSQGKDAKGFENGGRINLTSVKEGWKLERGIQFPTPQNIEKIVEVFESKMTKLSFKTVGKMTEDIFMLFKVSQENIMDVSYALSSLQTLVKLVQIFNEKFRDQENGNFSYPEVFIKLPQDFLNVNISILQMLAGKIYGTTYEDIYPSGNPPNKKIQKILVETGITQILIEIINTLYKPFKFIVDHEGQPSDDRAIRYRIQQIFQHTYILLEKIAVGLEENRIYLSRWVDIFLEHSNNINRSYIQECLVGILNNNPVSIEATINEEKIMKLINSFFIEGRKSSASLTTKYLRLFSTFIKCEDRVLKANQNTIMDKFFKSTENEFSFRFKKVDKLEEKRVEIKGITEKIYTQEVHIAFGKTQFTTIPKFYKDWTPKWNYFMHYVNLLANVSMDRNKKSIQNVSALLPLEYIAIILFDPQIKKLNTEINEKLDTIPNDQRKIMIANVHEPFVRVAHYVYINNEKFLPIKKIKKISRWYREPKIRQFYDKYGQKQQILLPEDINQTKRQFNGQKEEEEKSFLMAILFYIKQFLKECDQNPKKLSILFTILNLIRQTINLGLWESISHFREMIEDLVIRISKIQNTALFNVDPNKHERKSNEEIIRMNKSQLLLNRPNILLNIDCKIQAIEIIRLMNELEIDIRLRYIMKFFKGLYETTQNFGLYDFIEKEVHHELATIEEIDRSNMAKEVYHGKGDDPLIDWSKKLSEDQQIILKENVWYNKLKQMTPFTYLSENRDDASKNRYLFQGVPQEEHTEKHFDMMFKKIVLSFFELPSYQNHKLLNSSLVILRMMFQQRKDLLRYFKTILICGKGNLSEVYITLKSMRQKFTMLSNFNIVDYSDNDSNFSYKFWKEYDVTEKKIIDRSGIIQDLFFLTRTLKENISLKNIESLMFVDPDVFLPEQVYTYITERQENNKLFQSVNLAEGIYVPLIQYLKIMRDVNPLPQLHRKLLFSIFQYLTLLCYNYLEAKQILMEFIPEVLPFMKMKVGAANFICQLCKNNKLLVSKEEIVTMIIDAALESCISFQQISLVEVMLARELDREYSLQNFDYEKCLIFNALRGILIFNDQGFKRNQQILMNRLQDNRYRRLIFQKKFQYKDRLNNFSLNPSQAYIVHHFQLFSLLVESKNLVNIGKLENIHQYPYCLECLKNSNRWQIRRALRSYVNRLYYVNKEKDLFLFEEFIRKEFDIINVELSDLVELHKNKMLTDEIVVKNGIRFTYAQSQIYLMIIEVCISLHQMLLKPEFIKILKKELIKEEKYNDTNRILHEKIIKIFKFLGCMFKLYPNTKTISAYIREIKKEFAKIISKMQQKYLIKKAEPDADITEKPEVDELGAQTDKKSYVYDHSKSFFRNLSIMIRDLKARKRLPNLQNIDEEASYVERIFSVPNQKLKPLHDKKKRKGPAHENPHIHTNTSRAFKVLAKPQLNQNEENIELNRRLSTVQNLLEDSPIFKKFKEDQFYKIVEIFTNIDDISKEYYTSSWREMGEKSTAVIPINQIIPNIFKLIQEYPHEVSDSEKIFFIKIVRCFITEAVEEKQNYKLPIDQWDADYVKEHEQLFQKRQQAIMDCGGSDFIISIFQESLASREELLNEALLLGIAYLFGGNPKCQNSILQSLKKDPENKMLLSFRTMIKKIGDFIIDVRKMNENDKNREFAYNIVDTHDYYSMDQHSLEKHFNQKGFDKYEVDVENLNEFALCRMFRFLQLFGQNNNKDMKKFLTFQINEDGGRKSNSINFIEEGCFVLRNLYKIMNIRTATIPKYILGFIGEISQIPCLENQKSFMKSTYFEDLSYMASYFMSAKNQTFRKFQEKDLGQLFNIYEESVKLALSNFEGRDPIIIKEFINKCQPKFLWICIRDNLFGLVSEDYGDMVKVDEENAQNTMKATLENLTKENLMKIVESEKKKDKRYDGRIISILNVLTIINHIKDWTSKKTQNAQGNDPDGAQKLSSIKGNEFVEDISIVAREEYPFIDTFFFIFNELLLQIEVSLDNGDTTDFQYIYFPNHPVFKYLAGETKDSIMMKVNRGTQRDKLTSLIGFKNEVYRQVQWNYQLKYENIKLFGFQLGYPITSQLCERVRGYARNCSYLICFLLVLFIFVDHDVEEQSSIFVFDNIFKMILVRGLCLAQLGLTLLYCYFWGKMRAQLALNKYYDEGEGTEDKVNSNKEEEDVMEDEKGPQEGWITVQKSLSAHFKVISGELDKVKALFTSMTIYKDKIQPVIALQQYEQGFLSLAIFVFAAILGNFYGVEWYTIHLFDFFVNIPLLSNVFKAIIINIKELTILSFLATAFILVFNVLSFSTYTSVIYEEDIPEEACAGILNCVLELYTSGAIGDDMDTFEMGRFVFDIGYVVFMELLFQNLVGGIMIDGFASLRAQDDERDEDKKGLCYICSMTKADMEKRGQTFNKHTYRHCLWYYLYYIYILQKKDPTDFTGIESQIAEQIQKENVSWFPAMGESDGGNDISEVMENLKTKLQEIGSRNKGVLEKGIAALDKGKVSAKKKVAAIKSAAEIPPIEEEILG